MSVFPTTKQRLYSLPTVTQLISGRVRIRCQEVRFQSPSSWPLCCSVGKAGRCRCGARGWRQWVYPRRKAVVVCQREPSTGTMYACLLGPSSKISARVTNCNREPLRSLLSSRFCDSVVGLEDRRTKY